MHAEIAHNEADSQSTGTRQRLRRRGICVIIPTYNNAGTVGDVVRRTLRQCDDVIVVDDGCTDGTDSILAAIEGITVVHHTKNAGKGAALRSGFRKAQRMGFRRAITLDADGQHYPEDIPLLLEANIEHPDAIIVGERMNLDSAERSGGSKFANAFSNFWFAVQTLHPMRDTQTGYRLYQLDKLHGLRFLTSRYEAELELLVFSVWHGVKLVSTPVHVYYPPREERVSHFRPALDFTRISILNTVLCFLAVLYGVPLTTTRWTLTLLRTLVAAIVFIIGTIGAILPATVICHAMNSDRRTWMLHRLLHAIGRTVCQTILGMLGVKYQVDNPHGETFRKPAMVVCNHQSVLDIMAMLAQSPRIAILTKGWVWHNPFFGPALRHAEYYPMQMGMDELLPHLSSLVERGYSIAIYPEGTRSADGRIQRFHKGAFEIARLLQLDILPIVEASPCRIIPKGSFIMRRGTLRLQYGQRVTPDELARLGDTTAVTKWFRNYYKEEYAKLEDQL